MHVLLCLSETELDCLLFVSENEIFDINPDSGDITTKKPVDVAGPIVLMVMVRKILWFLVISVFGIL